MQAFGGKRCYFLRRYQKNKKKKNKDFRVLAKARPEESKSLVFLVFLVPLQENASFWWKTLLFPEEVPKKPKKPKILESWRSLAKARLEESKIFVFFGFFGTPPGKCKLLVENVAIS